MGGRHRSRASQSPSKSFECAGGIRQHVAVPKANYLITARFQPPRAGCVFTSLLDMLSAIEFNDQAAFRQKKSTDELSDGSLSAEFDTHPNCAYEARTKAFARHRLSDCEDYAPRQRALANTHEFAASDSTVNPLPNPPPQGGREWFCAAYSSCAPSTLEIACHTRLGVAGMSMSVTPRGASASRMALITAGGAPTRARLAGALDAERVGRASARGARRPRSSARSCRRAACSSP